MTLKGVELLNSASPRGVEPSGLESDGDGINAKGCYFFASH